MPPIQQMFTAPIRSRRQAERAADGSTAVWGIVALLLSFAALGSLGTQPMPPLKC